MSLQNKFFILLIIVSTPFLATANNQKESKQLIEYGFALRAQAFGIQSQTTNMIRSGRTLDKAAIKFRLNAKKNSTQKNQIDLTVLNQASKYLNDHANNFRTAHSDLLTSSDEMLREGFLKFWQGELIHTHPMQIAGSFTDGKTSEFLKISVSGQNRPKALNTSIARPSSNGLYYIIIQSLDYPLQINQFHKWKILITDNRANPLSKLNVEMKGDMPSHGHGMPTIPQLSPDQKPGIYYLEGMKFQMRGWWVITFTLEGKQGKDTVTFNLDL